MKPNDWSHLNHLQVGRYAEYLVKMEFTLWGFDVYTSEVDDRGIDFVIRSDDAERYFDVQVKSVRGLKYIFFQADKFEPKPNLLAAVVPFLPGQAPAPYLIPSIAWPPAVASGRAEGLGRLLVKHDYVGKKSKPEWGLNLSQVNAPLLEQFEFSRIVPYLKNRSANISDSFTV
jgi:hypothetical protein